MCQGGHMAAYVAKIGSPRGNHVPYAMWHFN